MKKIKILIVIIILMIIILIGMIFLLNRIKSDTNVSDADRVLGLNEIPEVKDGEVSPANFYIVQKCISIYLDNINKNNSAYYGKNNNGEYVKVIEDENIKNMIYNLLSKEYIQENNITKSNVYNFVEDIQEKQIFNILKIRLVQNENSDQYVVYGFLQSTDNKFTKYATYIVNMSSKNNVFSIEPISESVDDINKISVKDTTIEKNNNNTLPSVTVNAESSCREYLNLYKRMMLSKPEEAYQLLNEEYREKRFGGINEFKKYIDDNRKEIATITLSKYFINNNDEYKEYVCKDVNNNLYIFNVDKVTEYEVKLDTYTILTEEFKETYKSVNEQKKAQMNIDKWIEMLNNRDYKTAYEYLDKTFRENTFKSQEIFERYMRAKYPLHYSTQYTDYDRNSNLEILTVKLTDITGKNKDVLELKIVIKLEEDFKYSMSFEI